MLDVVRPYGPWTFDLLVLTMTACRVAREFQTGGAVEWQMSKSE